MRSLFARAGGICHLCGQKVALREATRDHRVPRRQVVQPPPADNDVLLAHEECNLARGDLPLAMAYEAVAELRRKLADAGIELTPQRVRVALRLRLKAWRREQLGLAP